MKTIVLFFALLFSAQLTAQVAHTNLTYEERFISDWKNIAIVLKEQNGIPASITIAQAMLESNCGRSELAVNANNLFGIKAFGWDGEVYEKQDDEIGLSEFRVYATPAECFIDRVAFLSKSRYASLYQLADTDYKGWANGLLRCGYATDTAYAEKLIAVIEKHHLYELDFEASNAVSAAQAGMKFEDVQEVENVQPDTQPLLNSQEEDEPQSMVAAGRPVMTASHTPNPPAAVRLSGNYSRGQKSLDNERGGSTTKKLNRKRSRSMRKSR